MSIESNATKYIKQAELDILDCCSGSAYGDEVASILEQAAYIRLAALAHYNIPYVTDILGTLLDKACEYPPFLDSDDAAWTWMQDNPQAHNDAYFEAADTVAQILIEVGEEAVAELVKLSERYRQSTRIETVANAIAQIGGPQAQVAIETMLAEYPIFKQPYFASPEMVWQTEHWCRSSEIAGGAAEARYAPIVIVGDNDVSLRSIVQYVKPY